MAGNRVSFFTRMRQLKKDIYARRDVTAGKLFAPVEKYVRGCKYTSYKDAERFVSMVLGGYSDNQIAERMQINCNTVRWREHDLSNILYGLFGNDFFDLMKDVEANRERLEKLIYLIKGSSLKEDYIPMDIVNFVSERADEGQPIESMPLQECYQEVDFLCRHSIPSILGELRDLDPFKLDYLFRIIEGNSGSLDDRYELMKLLDGVD